MNKAELYDSYVRQGDVLLRENSKIKSHFPIDIPESEQQKINDNNAKLKVLENKLMELQK